MSNIDYTSNQWIDEAPMYCTHCPNPKKLKGEKTRHSYKECGLEHITLEGITHYKCPECGEEYYDFHHLEQLHQAIADMLITKQGLLGGAEIRFLRKNLGYSSENFSILLGIELSTLSRIENSKQKTSASLDHAIRQAVFSKKTDRDYDLHDLIINKKLEKRTRTTFKLNRNQWILTS